MADPERAGPRGLRPVRLRCSICKISFRPHPRLRERQRTCSASACRRRHRAAYQRKYRRENPGLDRESLAKSGRPASFWADYRRAHPEATERNRLRSRLRKQLAAKGLQRKLDIAQVFDPPGYFSLFEGFATEHRSLIEDAMGTEAA
jgi:hypothetical protein